MAAQHSPKALLELTVVANFVEVFLAKHGHNGVVGINLLEKIQLPTIPSLFGAMLAKVDYVLMGAGIPRAIPAILDKLSVLQPAQLKLDVVGAKAGEEFTADFDPKEFVPDSITELPRPKFLAIISSSTLAISLVRKGTGRVDGFVVEGPTAGGHNAPPRGAMQLSDLGEPVYGPRDVPNLAEIAELGLPFWLAGSFADPEKLIEAKNQGAAGIQVGTAFAFCDESGIEPVLKKEVITKVLNGELSVFTDPLASPTGFPFKVLQLNGSVSESGIYEKRGRICDLGYLRTAYRKEDGSLGYRCPAEPEDDFINKGGKPEELASRKCVCNGLFATIGLPQVRKDGFVEPSLVTAGDDIQIISKFATKDHPSYSAKTVVNYLLGQSA